MYELKFSNYIKYVLQNPVAAQRLKDEVKKAYNKIKMNPFIYPAVPVEYLASKGYRFVNIKNYMLFFKVKEKKINIERFLYGPRDWINILNNMN